jgi:hypothetical protein
MVGGMGVGLLRELDVGMVSGMDMVSHMMCTVLEVEMAQGLALDSNERM